MDNQEYINIIMEGTKRFLNNFIKDSAYYVNRFLVGYTKDKMREILRATCADEEEIERELKTHKSYNPITPEFIWDLYLFYEALERQAPSKEDIVVYRGCDTLEDRATSGITATSLDINVAKVFNYGTLLKINIPAGSKYIVCKEFVCDIEQQILLPPCDYEIVSEHNELVDNMNTRVVEINIKPRDILDAFSLAMQRPSQDYMDEHPINEDYLNAFSYLIQIMTRRALNTYSDDLLKRALDNIDDPNYPNNKKGIDRYCDILLINFMIKNKNNDEESIKINIENEYSYVSPEEREKLLDIILKYKNEQFLKVRTN